MDTASNKMSSLYIIDKPRSWINLHLKKIGKITLDFDLEALYWKEPLENLLFIMSNTTSYYCR